MKRLILAAVLLMPGLSPGIAQNQSQRGMAGRSDPGDMLVTQRQLDALEGRLAALERVAAERITLEADLAKPCTRDAPFGCRTGTAK